MQRLDTVRAQGGGVGLRGDDRKRQRHVGGPRASWRGQIGRSDRLRRRTVAPLVALRQGTKGTIVPPGNCSRWSAWPTTPGLALLRTRAANAVPSTTLQPALPPTGPLDAPDHTPLPTFVSCRSGRRDPRLGGAGWPRRWTTGRQIPRSGPSCERPTSRPAHRADRASDPAIVRRASRGRPAVAPPAGAGLSDDRPHQLPTLPARCRGHDRTPTLMREGGRCRRRCSDRWFSLVMALSASVAFVLARGGALSIGPTGSPSRLRFGRLRSIAVVSPRARPGPRRLAERNAEATPTPAPTPSPTPSPLPTRARSRRRSRRRRPIRRPVGQLTSDRYHRPARLSGHAALLHLSGTEW